MFTIKQKSHWLDPRHHISAFYAITAAISLVASTWSYSFVEEPRTNFSYTFSPHTAALHLASFEDYNTSLKPRPGAHFMPTILPSSTTFAAVWGYPVVFVLFFIAYAVRTARCAGSFPPLVETAVTTMASTVGFCSYCVYTRISYDDNSVYPQIVLFLIALELYCLNCYLLCTSIGERIIFSRLSYYISSKFKGLHYYHASLVGSGGKDSQRSALRATSILSYEVPYAQLNPLFWAVSYHANILLQHTSFGSPDNPDHVINSPRSHRVFDLMNGIILIVLYSTFLATSMIMAQGRLDSQEKPPTVPTVSINTKDLFSKTLAYSSKDYQRHFQTGTSALLFTSLTVLRQYMSPEHFSRIPRNTCYTFSLGVVGLIAASQAVCALSWIIFPALKTLGLPFPDGCIGSGAIPYSTKHGGPGGVHPIHILIDFSYAGFFIMAISGPGDGYVGSHVSGLLLQPASASRHISLRTSVMISVVLPSLYFLKLLLPLFAPDNPKSRSM